MNGPNKANTIKEDSTNSTSHTNPEEILKKHEEILKHHEEPITNNEERLKRHEERIKNLGESLLKEQH